MIEPLDRADKISSLAIYQGMGHFTATGQERWTEQGREAFVSNSEENVMNWVAPIVEEICVGMEVTSYESADLDVLF